MRHGVFLRTGSCALSLALLASLMVLAVSAVPARADGRYAAPLFADRPEVDGNLNLPYPREEIFRNLRVLNPDEFERWWLRMPDYLKTRLNSAPLAEWQSIIICNYLGFKTGTPHAETCEQKHLSRKQSQASMWSEEGYIGPSDECRTRNKRSKWGELICDDPAPPSAEQSTHSETGT